MNAASLFVSLVLLLGWCDASSAAPASAVSSADDGVPITSIKIQNASKGATHDSVATPITFGQVFAAGDVPDPNALVGRLADGTHIPLQVDAKARHPDGSLRHAVISAVVPVPSGSSITVLSLNKVTAPTAKASGIGPEALLGNGFSASVNLTLDGQVYSASANDLLRSGKYINWLAGPQVNEWEVSAPLKTAQGVAHPNLSARFAIRSYTGINSASVDVTVENDWAFAPAPQNVTYDVQVLVGGKVVYTKSALKHFHHARWRKVFWWGTEPQVNLQHDSAYLISTKALPNYDQSLKIAASTLNNIGVRFSGMATEPMGNGLAVPYMPTTGGRGDIGLLPSWAVSYLLSMNPVAKKATLGTADLSGSWSMHYRNQKTNRPVSLVDFPYMTLVGNPSDTFNPATKRSEAFPACGGDCVTPYSADPAHEPALAYLPYLVTGDYYYLEELQFWAMFDLFESNPGYRANIKGLFHQTQVRAQAWTLRDLANAAYITPDADVLKKQFETALSDNLDWYNSAYKPKASLDNAFGALTDINARQYNNFTGIAPWQDDFFTSAVGHTVELGYAKAKPLLAWKAQFPIKRMIDPAYCWIVGAVYAFQVTDTNGGPIYTDMAKAYQTSNPQALTALPCGGTEMAYFLKLKVGEMTGHSSEPDGFPSNMQPALAYSVYSGAAGGADAWKVFMARSIKPDYSTSPQFAILPRQ
ncbi:hypothetical protein [Solimicrobium silvestre]|uniref:PcRGLX/YetA-like N-terminal RIFT barrel domain-containing protein n=1 Tax=Solimicrobium silvestre TaxID=2099400 RepID=A0A2S9GTC1_9BURK|nr:hypothetical protein [Solimicrobium silvestre]PRC90955.1 hypothetical protein S2091_4356 [Solimicrobium silvestre]